MKKVALGLLTLFIGAALADSTPTSVGYVDSQISALQNKISAVDTNTVLTHTNTAGEIGQKSIYDATGNYIEQQNALVTAEVANAAVQNAIDGEFVCTEWLDGAERTNENCLIYTVRNTTPNRILPTGYTPLEYLQSNGAACIDTGITYNTHDTGFAELDSSFTTLNYVGANAYMQLTHTNNDCLYIGYGALTKCVPMSNRNKIGQAWDGPTMTSTLYANGEFINKITWGSAYSGRYGIFSLGRGCGAKGRFYSLKLTANGTVVRHMLPARRDSDGALGAYDLVSNTFFTNSGTGEFIAGPELNVYLPSGN